MGKRFLALDGSNQSNLGQYLGTWKSTLTKGPKSPNEIKEKWLEILRHTKTKESSRIYRTIDILYQFSLDAKFIKEEY